MPSTICTPSSGRLRFAASELFLSVFGLPVSGSFGSFSQTIVPHSAPPQSATRMRDPPVWVSHVPVGSAASALPEPGSASTVTSARVRPILMSLLRTLGLPPPALLHILLGGEKAGKSPRLHHGRGIGFSAPRRGALRSWLAAGQPERVPVDDGIARTRADRAFSTCRRRAAESILHVRFIATFKSALKTRAR